MQRPDAYILKQIHRELAIAKKHLKNTPSFQEGWDGYFRHIDVARWANLPLISLTPNDLHTLRDLYDGNYDPSDLDNFIHWNEWFYETFTLYYPALDDGGYFWTTVWVDKKDDLLCFYGVIPAETKGYDQHVTLSAIPFHGIVQFDESGELIVALDPDYVKKMWTGAWAYTSLSETEIKSHVMAMIGNYMTTLNLLHRYIKEGDKHPVEVRAKAPANPNAPTNKSAPWRIKGPSLLLLDRMPSQTAPGTGTHASPTPHRRRGHWRTLSHPRYKNHPQYGSKIYVKPSFIGPVQEVYQGNVYRLIQPDVPEMQWAS